MVAPIRTKLSNNVAAPRKSSWKGPSENCLSRDKNNEPSTSSYGLDAKWQNQRPSAIHILMMLGSKLKAKAVSESLEPDRFCDPLHVGQV
mmetsp:Transcript_96636/g.171856  ORF Transcript_96636/g.171856 Transcript_96636/m.171856 type:complete len:90 (+) Transcript_96636:116-385(+)